MARATLLEQTCPWCGKPNGVIYWHPYDDSPRKLCPQCIAENEESAKGLGQLPPIDDVMMS